MTPPPDSPMVQMSLGPRWPISSMRTKRAGDGAALNASMVRSGATIPSVVPVSQRDGLSASSVGLSEEIPADRGM